MIRTEEEVDKMVEKMINRTKGAYITQGVAFNKTCPRQMQLLKRALMSSASFSGLAKEILSTRFREDTVSPEFKSFISEEKKLSGNVGNFI